MDGLATTQKLFFLYFSIWYFLYQLGWKEVLWIHNEKKSQLSFSLNLKNDVVKIWEGLVLIFLPFMHFKYPFVQKKMYFGNFLVLGEHTWKAPLYLPWGWLAGKMGRSWVIVEGYWSMSLCCLGEECVHSQVGVVLGKHRSDFIWHSDEWCSHSVCPQDH